MAPSSTKTAAPIPILRPQPIDSVFLERMAKTPRGQNSQGFVAELQAAAQVALEENGWGV